MQLQHENTSFEKKQLPITVVCDRIYFQENIGSVFRLCDAFGVSNIILFGKNLVFSERKINKTSRSTHKILPYELIYEEEILIERLNKFNQIIGIEITNNSISLNEFEFETVQQTALIIGSEVSGISEDILKKCHHLVHIPMFGNNSSMNVTHALSIVLYSFSQKF